MGTVVGLFESREQAVEAVSALKKARFPADDMSIVMRDSGQAADVAVDAGITESSGDAAATGAIGGGLLGGLAGLVLGAGALAIPGIGPIIAAGPIAAMLTGGALGAATGGIVGALTEAGISEDEAAHYQTGVERGGILLSVKVPDGREAEARKVLEHAGPHDIDYHRSKWESDPEFRYDIEAATPAAKSSKAKATKGGTKMATTGKHDDTKATVSTATGGTAGALAGAGIGAAVGGPVGAAVGAGIGAVTGSAAGGAVGYEAHEPELRGEYESSLKGKKGSTSAHSWEEVSPAYRYAWESYDRPEYKGKSYAQVSSDLKKGWTGSGSYADYEPHIKGAWEKRATQTIDAGDEAVVPVVEEELHVGKQKVEKGGVKVKSRVTETPVEADVHLHEEHVEVRRRAVNRDVTGADVAAFQEGTIELKETAERAVVSKKAKVVEEVVVSKKGSDKTQKVRDTVRKTDVEVEEIDTPEVVTEGGFETFRPAFEKHHKSHYAKAGSTFDEYSPAYSFGHTLAGDAKYRGSVWAIVEPQARKSWEARHEGAWEEFKDAIHHAWDKARAKL